MKIEKDKWKHFYVGLAMGLLFQSLGWHYLPAHRVLISILALVLIVCISYGFELFSLFTGWGHYEVMDAVAAVIGGLLGMGIVFLTVFLF
jgi:VanZ family protein